MRLLRSALIVLALCVYSTQAHAAEILIDFEDLADGATPSTEYAGVTFDGAMVLTAGSTLNEIEFPPVSGVNVVFNLVAEIGVDFSTPVSSVAGFLNYFGAVTLTAYSGAAVVGSVTSAFDANYSSSGNPTNELLQFIYSGGITRVVLAGAGGPGTFTLDNFQAQTIDGPPIPEPATATLFLIGAGAAWAVRRRRTRQHA